MISIKRVKTRRQIRQFLNFPLKLYKGNPYFVPSLYSDEKRLFRPDYEYYDQSEAVYFLAYDENQKVVGRISGILQISANNKWQQKRVRFTRFDSIDDQAVANALFGAVEEWARSKGMEEIVGPLGFSDFEREGLLISGFDRLSTYEEQYNYSYYQRLIENCGYEKEIDWTERHLLAPKREDYERIKRISDLAMKRYRLHIGKAKNTKDFLKKYADAFFETIDIAYHDIYGTVPMTGRVRKSMIKAFRLVINLKFVRVILDENDRAVCFGLAFPSIGKALQKSGGRLTPLTIVKVLRQIKHPDGLDFGLIGCLPEYRMKGISTVMVAEAARMLLDGELKYAETNLILETNANSLNQFKFFQAEEHKRRRAFIKKIAQDETACEAAPAEDDNRRTP